MDGRLKTHEEDGEEAGQQSRVRWSSTMVTGKERLSPRERFSR